MVLPPFPIECQNLSRLFEAVSVGVDIHRQRGAAVDRAVAAAVDSVAELGRAGVGQRIAVVAVRVARGPVAIPVTQIGGGGVAVLVDAVVRGLVGTRVDRGERVVAVAGRVGGAALARTGAPTVPDLLLKPWPGYLPDERHAVVDALTANGFVARVQVCRGLDEESGCDRQAFQGTQVVVLGTGLWAWETLPVTAALPLPLDHTLPTPSTSSTSSRTGPWTDFGPFSPFRTALRV